MGKEEERNKREKRKYVDNKITIMKNEKFKTRKKIKIRRKEEWKSEQRCKKRETKEKIMREKHTRDKRSNTGNNYEREKRQE